MKAAEAAFNPKTQKKLTKKVSFQIVKTLPIEGNEKFRVSQINYIHFNEKIDIGMFDPNIDGVVDIAIENQYVLFVKIGILFDDLKVCNDLIRSAIEQ